MIINHSNISSRQFNFEMQFSDRCGTARFGIGSYISNRQPPTMHHVFPSSEFLPKLENEFKQSKAKSA